MVDDRRNRQEEREAREDPFTRASRQFDNHVSALFNSLWSLPAAIYERGNEHGREFGRIIDERQRRYDQQRSVGDESRDEEKQEQEQEDARGKRACGWRGRHHHGWQRRQQEGKEKAEEEERDGAEAGEWLKRVAMEVEANAKEAERLYEDYEKKVLQSEPQGMKGVVAWWNEPFAEYDADELQKLVERRRAEATDVLGRALRDEAKHPRQERSAAERETWTDLFPAWSATQPHKNVDAPEPTDAEVNELAKRCPAMRDGHHGPIVATAQQVEDAIARANADWEALMKGTSQIAKAVQESYNRDARLWSQEGLFGPHMPFSGPLSTMFSMGLRPFMPQDSAMGYLLFSEYSPLHLEHEKGFDASFRRRFEDLVRIQSGKPIDETVEKEEGGTIEWLGRMSALLEENEAKEGKKDDWEALWQQASTGHVEEPMSEMDVYERQLHHAGPVQPVPPSQQPSSTKSSTTHWLSSSLGDTNTEPSILSTLTTTERHVAADGTVTTKTVLKKRFADGREEVEDSTTTEEPKLRRRQERASRRKESAEKFREQKRMEAEQESKIAKEAKKSGGWFWSS